MTMGMFYRCENIVESRVGFNEKTRPLRNRSLGVNKQNRKEKYNFLYFFFLHRFFLSPSVLTITTLSNKGSIFFWYRGKNVQRVRNTPVRSYQQGRKNVQRVRNTPVRSYPLTPRIQNIDDLCVHTYTHIGPPHTNTGNNHKCTT